MLPIRGANSRSRFKPFIMYIKVSELSVVKDKVRENNKFGRVVVASVPLGF